MENKELSLSFNEYNQLEAPVDIQGIQIEKVKNIEVRLILHFPSLDLSVLILGELTEDYKKVCFSVPVLPLNKVEDNITEASIEIIIDKVYYPICNNVPFLVKQPKITMNGNITVNTIEDDIKNKVNDEVIEDEEKESGIEEPPLVVDKEPDSEILNSEENSEEEIKATPEETEDSWDDEWDDDIKEEEKEESDDEDDELNYEKWRKKMVAQKTQKTA